MGCSRICPCLVTLIEIVPIMFIACLIRYVKLKERYHHPSAAASERRPSLRAIVEPVLTFTFMLAIPLVYVLYSAEYPSAPCRAWVSAYAINCIGYTVAFYLRDPPNYWYALALYVFDTGFFVIPGVLQVIICVLITFTVPYLSPNPRRLQGRRQECHRHPPCPFCQCIIPMPEFNFDLAQLELD